MKKTINPDKNPPMIPAPRIATTVSGEIENIPPPRAVGLDENAHTHTRKLFNYINAVPV